MNTLISGRVRIDTDTEWFSELTYSRHQRRNQPEPVPGLRPAAGFHRVGQPEHGGEARKSPYPACPPSTRSTRPARKKLRLPLSIRRRPVHNQTNTTQYRALTGLKGTYQTFDWGSAVGMMGGHTGSLGRGAFSDSGFIEEIGDYNADTLAPDSSTSPGGYVIGGANSAGRAEHAVPGVRLQRHEPPVLLDGKISGDIAQLPAGALQLATGFELRHKTIKINPTDNLANGDIVGLWHQRRRGRRNFGAVFAEVGIPIVKNLDGDIAGRLDKFPGFGAHFSPKVGLKFKPVEQALFRGAYETGFRAPNLPRAPSPPSSPSTRASAIRSAATLRALHDALLAKAKDPSTDAATAAVLEARALQVQDNECGASIPIVTANNPSLKPETSKSFSLGTVLQASSRWSMSADYWAIHRRNEIGTRDLQDLLTNEDTLPSAHRQPRHGRDGSDVPGLRRCRLRHHRADRGPHQPGDGAVAEPVADQDLGHRPRHQGQHPDGRSVNSASTSDSTVNG